MTNTLPTEKWGLTESTDRWSAGQAARQQIYGTATEMMLELGRCPTGQSSAWTLRRVQVIKRSWRLDVSDQQAMYWPQTIPPAC